MPLFTSWTDGPKPGLYVFHTNDGRSFTFTGKAAADLMASTPKLEANPYATTTLSADEEAAFQQWAKANKIGDVNDPRAFYDYRGYWKEKAGEPIKWGVDHFPDTYKQPGHETFSVESQYANPTAGSWEGETYIPAAPVPVLEANPYVLVEPATEKKKGGKK
jgi:hypothetical protein